MPDFAAMPAALAPWATEASNAPTSVSLFDQGLIQVLEAAVSGLQPKQSYVLALAENPNGTGVLQPLQSFMTNPAGAAIECPSNIRLRHRAGRSRTTIHGGITA